MTDDKPSRDALDLLDRQHLPFGNRLEFQDLVVVSRRLAAREIDALLAAEREKWQRMYSDSYLAKVTADYKKERESGEELLAALKAERARSRRLAEALKRLKDQYGELHFEHNQFQMESGEGALVSPQEAAAQAALDEYRSGE